MTSRYIKFFKIDDAINAPINSNSVFIIANERLTKEGQVGRYYTIFNSFQEFLKVRSKYPHCHEILVDHQNNKPNIAGRLVFDFDIKKDISVPDDFKMMVENTILDVIDTYYKKINSEKIEFVWSTSQNPNKFSKHLTIKNIYFDDWIKMSKLFYNFFCIIWDEKYDWIKSTKLIDAQIVRIRASLRMVGSSKINGYPLVFDNKDHHLVDSLIRIYDDHSEQLITFNHIIKSAIRLIENQTKKDSHLPIINYQQSYDNSIMFDNEVYLQAYKLFCTLGQNSFKMGKNRGQKLSLLRTKASECLLSGNIHENENAFLKIFKQDDSYLIMFGCYRYCYKRKMIVVGTLTLDNLIGNLSDEFKKYNELLKK